jgi:oligopeptide transport system permease protein
MTVYVIRRVLWFIPVLFFVSLITFLLMHAIPGGPWDEEKKLPEAAVANLNAKYGLDKPLWQQYLNYLAGLLRGDLGPSYQRTTESVQEILAKGLRATALLGVLALGVALVVGIGLGVLAAIRRNTIIDYLSVTFATAGAAIPSFVMAILLIYVFSVQLHLLPTSGWGSPKQVIMPTIALSLLPAAFLARITRASMLEVLGQDYVRTARAKGIHEIAILNRHALRNALIPVLTVIGPLAANLLVGSFIIEFIFAVPGVGRLFVQAVQARDYGVIMGATLFYALVVAVANLVVDITYAAVDPRIRYS